MHGVSLMTGEMFRVPVEITLPCSPLSMGRALRSIKTRIFPPEPKPLILMYHRIADVLLDPWGIAVSPSHFREHLDVLRNTRTPLTLTDFVRGLRSGTLSSDAVAITFDDGYVDNLVEGKPRLSAADVPATVFLPTGYLDWAGEFWWDELARLILVGAGPRNLELAIQGKVMCFDLGENITLPGDGWRAWLDPARTPRQQALLAIWGVLRKLGDTERETLMAGIRRELSTSPMEAGSGRPMTSEEVRALVSDGLIAIGSHTVSRPLLTALDVLACRREMAVSKHACEVLAGAEVRTFAYPFGDFDAEVRAAVVDEGFICACSTRYSPVFSTSDFLALPRIQVFDSSGEVFERSLRDASLAPAGA